MKQEMTTEQFGKLVEQFAPLGAAYSWDNSGWNIRCHEHIRSVLVCMDVTEKILEEAKQIGADTILTHHPLLFHATKQWYHDQPVSCVAMQAVQQGVNVYCAHTSFDCAPEGMDHVLAAALGLQNVQTMLVEKADAAGKPLAVLGTVGELAEEMPVTEAAVYIKEKLAIPQVRVVPAKERVQKIACVGGAGGDFLEAAVQAGADALLTGEVKHNIYHETNSLGLTLYEVGHYDSEAVFCRHMCNCLQKTLFALQYNLTVKRSEVEVRPYLVI